MSIQAVSFGKKAITKNGNEYNKSTVGGKAGLIAGAALSGFYGAKTVKIAKNSINANTIRRLYERNLSKLPNGLSFKDFAKGAVKGTKIGLISAIGLLTVTTMAMCFGLGKIVDAFANKIKAKKADEAAKTEKA